MNMNLSLPTPGAHPAPFNRREVIVTAAGVGAVALTGGMLGNRALAPSPVAISPVKTVDRCGGYRVTEHVRRFYEVARA